MAAKWTVSGVCQSSPEARIKVHKSNLKYGKERKKKAVKEGEGVITSPRCSAVSSCVDTHRALESIQDLSTLN